MIARSSVQDNILRNAATLAPCYNTPMPSERDKAFEEFRDPPLPEQPPPDDRRKKTMRGAMVVQSLMFLVIGVVLLRWNLSHKQPTTVDKVYLALQLAIPFVLGMVALLLLLARFHRRSG